MKKLLLLFLVFTVCNHLFAQQQVYKFIKENYRVNPFEGSFSSFIKALSYDPELKEKTLIRKTDTSNYFLKGTYNIFNPFGINANKVEMIFAEHEMDIEVRNQLQEFTIYTYQILAYFDDTKANRNLLTKEYDKLKKKLRRDLSNEISSLKGVNNVEDGEIANYFYNRSILSPITLSWQTLSKSKKLALTIITKLAVQNNITYLATGTSSIVLSSKSYREREDTFFDE